MNGLSGIHKDNKLISENYFQLLLCMDINGKILINKHLSINKIISYSLS